MAGASLEVSQGGHPSDPREEGGKAPSPFFSPGTFLPCGTDVRPCRPPPLPRCLAARSPAAKATVVV